MWSLYNTTPIPPSTTPKPGAFQVWGKMWHNAVILVLDGGRGGEENEKDAGGDESSVVGRS